jgi:deoxyribodipyrimidine photo-lyase
MEAKRPMLSFQPLKLPQTRADAHAAARAFAPRMGYDYAKGRNHVVPGHPHVSMLASAIRVRLLLETEAAQIALDEHESLSRCEKFVQEIHWRSYWRSWLELRPDVWTDYCRTRDEARANLNKFDAQRIEEIESGESGVEVMDNFARELVQTGYLHNHARMWFAAYWIHAARLPMELGADFFERHLICACPAANTLSWRWVAGLQTRGKAYLARRSNIEKYCDAAYLGESLGMEQLEKPSAAPIADEDMPNPQTPEFEIELPGLNGKSGLWISEDDLSPETSVLHSAKFAAICTSVVGAPAKSSNSNGARRDYRLAAARDAGERATKVWNGSSTNFEAPRSEDLAGQIAAWARENELKNVVALKPFVGPTNDALELVRAQLDELGVSLHLLRRVEDARMLDFANRGFFKFWQECEEFPVKN